MRPAWIATLLTGALALPCPARACGTAWPPGARVQIADEEAVIVWDAKAKREDFVRRASFRGTAAEFGFLVPTPAKPELAEVPDQVFFGLEDITRPEVVSQHVTVGVDPMLLCALPFRRERDGARAGSVHVLATQRVAGFDAVVLEADSAGALAAWLKNHGYVQRPSSAAGSPPTWPPSGRSPPSRSPPVATPGPSPRRRSA